MSFVSSMQVYNYITHTGRPMITFDPAGVPIEVSTWTDADIIYAIYSMFFFLTACLGLPVMMAAFCVHMIIPGMKRLLGYYRNRPL